MNKDKESKERKKKRKNVFLKYIAAVLTTFVCIYRIYAVCTVLHKHSCSLGSLSGSVVRKLNSVIHRTVIFLKLSKHVQQLVKPILKFSIFELKSLSSLASSVSLVSLLFMPFCGS